MLYRNYLWILCFSFLMLGAGCNSQQAVFKPGYKKKQYQSKDSYRGGIARTNQQQNKPMKFSFW